MKVYCDRLATVTVDAKTNSFSCPKCRGVCVWSDKRKMYDCLQCARGWEQVPDDTKTEDEAMQHCIEQRRILLASKRKGK